MNIKMATNFKRSIRKVYVYTAIFSLLLISKVIILIVPFKKIVSLTKTDINKEMLDLSPSNKFLISYVRNSLMMISKYSPVRFNCFHQALTGKLFFNLHKIPSKIYFGMRRDSKNDMLKAHAWLKVDTINISGGKSSHLHTELLNIK